MVHVNFRSNVSRSSIPVVRPHSQRLLGSMPPQTLVHYRLHPTEAAGLWHCLLEAEPHDRLLWQPTDAAVSPPDPEAGPRKVHRTGQWWTALRDLSPLTNYRWYHGSGLNQSHWPPSVPHWFPRWCPQVVGQETGSVGWRQVHGRCSPPLPPRNAEGWRSPGLQPEAETTYSLTCHTSAA